MAEKADSFKAQSWIDGKPFNAAGATSEKLLSPWDNSLVATVSMADKPTINKAVASSRSAFQKSRQVTPAVRADWLRRAADEIDHIKDNIAETTMCALGKPRRACGVEAGRVSQLMRLCAEELLRM